MVRIYHSINPDYGIHLNMMNNSGYLDLENRKNKTPGGFTAPLSNRNSSFILTNFVGTHRDVLVFAHEGGHSMHAFRSSFSPYQMYRDYPSELAELASMAMELFALDHFDEFYDDPTLKKAKIKTLEDALRFLPWCMIIDAFQHWIYLNPNHTNKERSDYFLSLLKRFEAVTGVDYSGIEELVAVRWMKQSHIFRTPFYYIEYGIAQLGAIALYKNFRENGPIAIEHYDNFLKLGYSKGLKEAYETAGIKFDFSEEYISELVDFVKAEIKLLEAYN